MKSLKYRLKKHEVNIISTDWNKYDDRLMKAVERGEVDKVAAVLSKKGITPTKLDVEGRSAFHLAATRGHLDCLNQILGHNVDITATDATGKNALHLASRNGHSLCVQKLLQHNCPVGNVDLQGRTALHDAVMAGCTSSVKLLSDIGASVNAIDFDGRTPLVLATQMCHPHICKLLLERGADITLRDKQNKTALILGCEYGCKDAVEVLLRGGADVMAVDGLGHDPYHYARLNKNQELLAIVKTHLDNANRVKEAVKLEQRKRQQSLRKAEEKPEVSDSKRDQKIHDLEKQNENQQESLRKFQQEQRTLLEQVNMLQQQLTQEKIPVEDVNKEREQLKRLGSVKDREEGPRPQETVKVQLKNTVGDYSGQSVIKGKENILSRQSHSFDSSQMLQNTGASHFGPRAAGSGPHAAGWEPAGDTDTLRRELDTVRKRLHVAEEDRARLQSTLNRKNQECQDVAASREALRKQADRQVQELEDALGDVQKRMVDSECKVKQLQAHVVAVKEHLGGQAADELRGQLQEVKAKYEGASAEVGRVRNRLKQSEKALEEYKSSEGQLATEAERLGRELDALRGERDALAGALQATQGQLQEAKAKPGNVVPAEKFDNMKNLLTNAVDEKERQLAELREDYDRVLEEVAELHRAADSQLPQAGKATMPSEEHQRIRAALDDQNASLKRRLADVTAKSQVLIREVEESEEEREILREQLDELNGRMEAEFVPLGEHEEAKLNMVKAMEELEDKIVEASERFGKAEAQVQQLDSDRASLRQIVTGLKASSEKQQSEMEAVLSQKAEMAGRLELLQKKCEEREGELARLTEQSGSLEQRLDRDYVPRERHEQVNRELSVALEAAVAQISKLEAKEKESGEELRNVKDGSNMLKEKLEKVLCEMEKDYVSLKEHDGIKVKLSNKVSEAESHAKGMSEMYASSQEETRKLNEELEAQKKELDTIHEAIASKFVPRTAVKEEENSHKAKVQDLTEKLLQMEENYNTEKSAGERLRREMEDLRREVGSLQERLENACKMSKEAEGQFKGRLEEATLKSMDAAREYREEATIRAKLEEQNALNHAKIHSLEARLQAESARVQGYDQAAVLAQHGQEKKDLEAEADVAELRGLLREEQEKAEDVAALRSELLRATHALEELRGSEEQASRLKAENRRLEGAAGELGERLLGETERCDGLQRDTVQAREAEERARTEVRSMLEKGQAIDRETRELKERYDESIGTIGDLQRRIQLSAEQIQVKEKKIAELMTDVEQLKQAVNGLSQLAYAGSAPNKRQTQHIDTLQGQLKSLQQQLADAERQHREVVSIYRTHLLSAAQGHMDEDVQAALLQIIRMRQEFVC
ncbi:uveal autoantigen with coiled-coil domains and ankyrin repeats protein [Gadus chalcogrammus]|uniref:uveal autoantigen with coiled-coil domains and ankyrin repeats protein n=1 Tax=Gadus chalcogrammus TaxID=1042646 RepID=UPI0024C4BB3A|nr:uveal autoantigen with coiled-coil domains and ankyrin repeats protein [Gadus chalcogrammus]